ncbi:hypothetical protein C8R45DRAFT_1143005 [Mycena sanguinolenta]|nr:hypothetical protein C8R45DRAFT_1143005 [Mycena sanguinolenta]
MNALSLRSVSPETDWKINSSASFGNDTAENLLESAASLLAAARKDSPTWGGNTQYEGGTNPSTAPERSWQTATRTLQISSLVLHSTLAATHFLLIGVWATGLTHRFTITLEEQKFASFVLTTSTTTCGTIYSTVLVFITQALATRRNLRRNQMLTATHDNTAAWAGLGAAVAVLWNQMKVPSGASIAGLLSAIIYLVAILGIHITSSSLFSLVAFTSTRTFRAGTRGLPAFGTPNDVAMQDMDTYAYGSLYFLPFTLNNYENQGQGLYEGTLYDMLDTVSSGPGNATVDATGFNLTCGFFAVSTLLVYSEQNAGWIPAGTNDEQFPEVLVLSTRDGLIFYSTIPVIDGNGEEGPSVELSPPMNTTVSSIQIFQCSLSLVPQVAVVDSQSRQIRTVEPDITKTSSKWNSYAGNDTGNLPSPNAPDSNELIDQWESWYCTIPTTDFLLDYSGAVTHTASAADIYLAQKLNLSAANHSDTENITLHDFENALSAVVASIFWTCHIHPPYRTTYMYGASTNGTVEVSLNDITAPLILLPGNATVTEIYTEAQLECVVLLTLLDLGTNTLQVSVGLGTSMVHLIVSLPLLRRPEFDDDLPIDGTGILHAIWLYRNHPTLDRSLEQVEHPTDENLRAAGMVQTRLIGDEVQDEEKCEGV